MTNLRPPQGGLFFFILLLLMGPLLADDQLCPGILVYGHKDLHFTKTEKRLVCGDSAVEGYQSIPLYQAKIFMTGFLQSRGHLSPIFTNKDEVLYVDPGKVSKIKKINVNTGETKERHQIKEEILKLYKKKDLTPENISSVETSARSVLRSRGYPCAEVESEAIIEDKAINLGFKKLVYHNFGEVKKEKIEGLYDNALERFYPFKAKDKFDERLLFLTEKRMRMIQVVSATYFLENCSPDAKEFSLSQYFILGPPTIRFGVGANTEAGPLARLQWSNNRSGPMASQRNATLQASFRIQTINFSLDEYLWRHHPRQSLLTQFEITRESQFDFQQSLVSLGPHMKWTEDVKGRLWTYTLGPTLEAGRFKTLSDTDPTSYKNTAFDGSISWMSHPYELYEYHPEEGNSFIFDFDYRDPRFGFPDPLLKLESTFVSLNRIGVWERGNLIGGLRFIGGTTIVPSDVNLNSLPPTVKFYGGGSDDIRGFLIKTLPKNDGTGALSKFVLKFELRRTNLFRKEIEGFSFLDGGRFGETSWTLDKRVWYSPGLGIRWFSKYANVQTFVARGLATYPKQDFGNFYFVGIGGVF